MTENNNNNNSNTKNSSSKPLIAIIAAMSENNVISLGNEIPWYIRNDLKRFKMLTTGNEVIVGRKTYESLIKKFSSEKVLPNRDLKIISSQEGYHALDNRELYTSIESAIKASDKQLIWSIGGGQIYSETIKYADVMEITKVNKLFANPHINKIFFPPINHSEWTPIRNEKFEGYSFITYIRNDDENGTLDNRIQKYERIIKEENKQMLKNKIYN